MCVGSSVRSSAAFVSMRSWVLISHDLHNSILLNISLPVKKYKVINFVTNEDV